MPTDVQLEETRVLVRANSLRIEGEDVEVRSPQIVRQISPNDFRQNKPRRALKHGERDQLVVNGDADYVCTEIAGALEIRAKNVPATIYMKDKNGNNEVFISLGLIQCSRDVSIKGLKTKSGSESVLKTLQWLINRVAALEKKAGMPEAAKIKEDQPG